MQAGEESISRSIRNPRSDDTGQHLESRDLVREGFVGWMHHDPPCCNPVGGAVRKMNGPLPSVDVLNRLANLEGIEIAEDLHDLGNRLGPALERYAELELRSDSRRIDLITLETSPAMVAEFASVLEDRGIAPEHVERISALGRFGAGSTIGMKLPVAGPLDSGELYVRAALPLAEVQSYLERHGASEAALQTIARIAGVLDTDHSHMLAADAARSPPHFTCLFTTWLSEESDDRSLREVLDVLEVAPAAASRTMEVHSLLGASRPQTLYVSVPVSSDGSPTRLKLDYSGVRLGLAAEVSATVDSEATATRLLRTGDVLDARTISYFGVVVGSDGPEGTRAYFTRHSSRSR